MKKLYFNQFEAEQYNLVWYVVTKIGCRLINPPKLVFCDNLELAFLLTAARSKEERNSSEEPLQLGSSVFLTAKRDIRVQYK